jgi:adenylate cyclase
MQDEISDAVTIAVVPAVADAELRRAMRKPPGSLDARAAYQAVCGISTSSPQTTTQSHRSSFKQALARRAGALDGSDAEARSSLGLTLALLGDSKGGLAEIERALAISPNLASAHGALGAARPKRPYPLLSARKPKRSCARSLRRYSSGG